MPNPKNISSYPPKMVMLVHQVATNPEPTRLPVHFESSNRATYFSSRFYTLKKLLVRQAQEEGDYGLANQLEACGLRSLDTDPETRRPIAWEICNGQGGLDLELDSQLDEALRKLGKPSLSSLSDPNIQPLPNQSLDGFTPGDDPLDEEDSAIGSFLTGKISDKK